MRKHSRAVREVRGGVGSSRLHSLMNSTFIQPLNRKLLWIVWCKPFKGSDLENPVRVVQLKLRSGHIHISAKDSLQLPEDLLGCLF